MLHKILQFLWGDLNKQEVKKFGLLSLALFFTIASYWLLRPLKDGIFKSLIGMSYQPKAKVLTLIIMIPLILIYSKLVNVYKKDKLFYIISFFYGFLFLIIGLLLLHPTIGLANTVKSCDRILGWVCYVSIESMGSILIALFWSFVASSVDSDSAKRGFALIVSGGQLGGILGPTLATYSEKLGLPLLFCIAALFIFIVSIVIKIFMRFIKNRDYSDEFAVVQNDQKPTGIWEGLKLLCTKKYLLGIFVIATFYEVIGTIVDYQMKVLAEQTFLTPESFTAFMGLYGQYANFVALILALVGTSYLMRSFGLIFCLLAFPIAIGVVTINLYLHQGLWAALIAMIAIKSLSYALNNPSKEMMYIPTSKDVKFKAKSWIDMFGGRFGKAAGSGINNIFQDSITLLMFYGTIVALGLVSVWIVAAILVGAKFNYLVKNNKIIE
ncbi:MAG: Npt1/Npt2 family nucleotide transporter [Candidatus Babeliales bacterium]